MTTKRAYTSLTPLNRERLLKEAMARARARAERPQRQVANARRLAELRSRLGQPAERPDAYMEKADRMNISDRTRNAAMDVWRRDHEAQLAKRD
jgi:hypothetical protein